MRQQDFAERFAESDAAESERRAERRAYLIGALAKVRASSDLLVFVRSVYRHTGGLDESRWWSVSIGELIGESAAPASRLDPLDDRLGCSRRQAMRVTALSRKLGLVRARPAGRQSSRDGVVDDLQPGETLEYQIDWVGVRRQIGLIAREVAECQPGTGECQPGTGECQPGTGECQPGTGECQPGTGHIRNTRAPAVPVPVPYRVFEREQNRNGTGTGAAGPRLLDGVTLGCLRDTRQMLGLLDQVCEVAPISGLGNSEADQLWWLTAAEYALRVGNNPVSYWRYLVFGNRRGIPKLVDEDAARKRLREVEACRT
jgi:hypothetical protein